MNKLYIYIFLSVIGMMVFVGCATPNTMQLDSDHDGVINSKDVCPNTPPMALVDKYGCALDSDHDGVIDLYDKCPNTPSTDLVDKNGCSIKK